MMLGDPWFLALLVPVLVVAVWRARRPGAAADGGSERILGGVPGSWRSRTMWLPGALFTLAAILLVGALARPLKGREESQVITEGIDIMLVVDASSSMSRAGIEANLSNLVVVKEVVARFVEARENDRLGLLSFAAYPRSECPLTLDKQAVLEQLQMLEVVRANSEEDGTAIGVAVGFAASKLKDSDAKSRVIILLTDGEQNVTTVDPEAATRLCKELGIKVYTVGAGRVVIDGLMGRREVPLNTHLLESMARDTGGRFFRARDGAALQAVYDEIDALERTERLDVRYTDYEDLYLWLIIPAAALIALGQLLSRGPYLEFTS